MAATSKGKRCRQPRWGSGWGHPRVQPGSSWTPGKSSGKDWERTNVVVILLMQEWAMTWRTLTHTEISEWINGSGGVLVWVWLDKARSIQRAQESEETHGSKRNKWKNLAHLEMNTGNKDGNSPLSHKTFVRRWPFYIICWDIDVKKSFVLLQQGVFWLATREHLQNAQGVEHGERLETPFPSSQLLTQHHHDVSLHPRVHGPSTACCWWDTTVQSLWPQVFQVPARCTRCGQKHSTKYSWQEP